MSRPSIIDRLQSGEVLVMDGATGSELQRRGVDVDKGSVEGKLGVWSAAANLDAPDVVRAIHEHFFTIGQGEYTPERYAEAAVGWKEIGAQLIGGCCATTPDHIRAVRAAVKSSPVVADNGLV